MNYARQHGVAFWTVCMYIGPDQIDIWQGLGLGLGLHAGRHNEIMLLSDMMCTININ